MRALGWVVAVGLISFGCGVPPVPDAGVAGGGAGGGVSGGGAGGGGGVASGGGTGDDAGVADAGLVDAGLVDAGVCDFLALPPSIDFGAVMPGCNERKVLTLRNPCNVPLAVAVLTSGVFSASSATLTVAARSAVEVPITFSPNALGAITGLASVTSAHGVIDVPLIGLGDNTPFTTDTFQQPARPRANLLFVVSDGPGMSGAQQALKPSLSSLLQYSTSAQLDFRIGVLAGRFNGGSLVGGVITPTMPNLQQAADRILLGSAGTPTESCLERAVQHLAASGDWLIARGSFTLICVQNTTEQLTMPAAASLRSLRTLAGNPSRLRVLAMANFKPGCSVADDTALRDVVDATGGALTSICAPDLGFLESVAVGYETTFPLTRPLNGAPAFDVQLDGLSLPAVDPGTASTIWTYDAALNAIVFEPLYVPEPGKTLTVRYASGCAP